MSPLRTMEPSGLEATLSGEPLDLSGRVSGDLGALDEFERELGRRLESRSGTGFLPRRVNADPANAEKDLAKLVLALVDLVRQLMERQAVRRVNAGSLSEEEVERMGDTFLKLERKMAELRMVFGLKPEDINLDLGPLGKLL